ncbi:hypothetical protein PFICI_11699 [Pestalotiopsis fici W106-1]|uniref:DUF7729 domain-containing protein n=1 Tax=Pestalotiopsis fici (strain W106-1 / CGMCC3.15140) TaxID=1229662 RepID=W3WT54_PESFW|nr:uncharacterized protein PFICI_11699 [Pestalotiopsis fici W106-1]ETS76312.1 hypothetical protein PFICI_11699 [Pestalotiopsis fici W106-1]
MGLDFGSGADTLSFQVRAGPKIHKAMIFAAILCWGSLVSLTTAFSIVAPPHPYETLIVDTRVPVLIEDNWVMMSREDHQRFLQRRAAAVEREEDSDTTTTEEEAEVEAADSYPTATSTQDGASTTTIPISVTTTTSSSSTKTATTTTRTASSSPLPSPLDNAIASNFTGNGECQEFITNMLADSTFKSCYPFSMLVQGSLSMFNAEKSLFSITQVLDATCSANVTFCVDYLDQVASNLTETANCADDYEQQNSVVVQAYLGLKGYQPLYSASCLQDADTSAYCFANAVTNSSAIADTYLYYLPLNISYPNITTPDCNSCTKNVLGIFQAATADRDAAIANTYADAANAVNAQCGAGFVNATLPEAQVSSAAVPGFAHQAPSLLLWSLFVAVLSQWLL